MTTALLLDPPALALVGPNAPGEPSAAAAAPMPTPEPRRPSSPARVAANRANAQRSTGPKTEAGKAISRRNAVRHGLAGSDDPALGAAEAARVEARAGALVRELGVAGEAAVVLARRAAVLSLRMECAARRELVVVARDRAAARAAFDAERQERVDALVAALACDPTTPADARAERHRAALRALEGLPEGIGVAIELWEGLATQAGQGDPIVVRAASEVARGLLDLDPAAVRGWSAARWRERIAAEVARLQARDLALDAARQRVAQQREEAGDLATFDTSPEACLARRYEAHAQSGFFRALQALRHLRTADGPALGPTPAPATPAPAPTTPPPVPPPPPAGPAVGSGPGLGSFRPPVGAPSVVAGAVDPSPPADRIEARRRRPDPLQLIRHRR